MLIHYCSRISWSVSVIAIVSGFYISSIVVSVRQNGGIMKKNGLIPALLCFSLSLATIVPVYGTSAADLGQMPPSGNDPGFERLSGLYEPAAESNIVNGPMEEEGDLSEIASLHFPWGNLKTLSSTTSDYTGKIYNHASEFDGMNIYNGIDVSYHQGRIDWESVKNDGIDFAIIRLGYRGYANGSLAIDKMFTTYMEGAIASGLPVGVYFWTEAVDTEEALEEAEFVIDKLSPYKDHVTMPVVIDWELNSNSRHGGLSQETNTDICSTFCDTVASNGYTPMIYANLGDLNKSMDGESLSQKYEIWVARYNNIVNNSTSHFYGDYSMWQYSSSGTVDGIGGNVDMNFWYTTGSPESPSFTYGATAGAITTSAPAPTEEPQPSPATEPEIYYLDDIDPFTARSASKSITLSWGEVADADGYEIWRKDIYDGSYEKVATKTDSSTTSWKDTDLDKKHEYYYRIRAYHKNTDRKIYSDYSKITVATKSTSQVGLVKRSLVLYKKPVSTPSKLMTAPKGTPLEYVGITHRKNGNTYHHYRYYTASKVYDAYRTEKSSITYYDQGTTTAHLNLRQNAGTSAKLLSSIPKNTAIPLIGSKRIKGTTWYKTCFSSKKKVNITGYVSGNYVRK